MPGPVLVYTDEHIATAVIKGLRKLGVGVLTCREAGMMSATDDRHLDRAHALSRSVLTRDSDFLRLHTKGVEHSGILFIPRGRSIREIISGTMEVYQRMTADQMRGHVEYLKGRSI